MRGSWRWRVSAALSVLYAGPAWAGDKPLYQPAPAWVVPAPTVDATKLTDTSPVLLTLDRQQRLEDGTVWSYTDIATRMATPEVATQAGTITVPWQPATGDLVVHKLEIIRGTQHIDLLAAGKRFEVIRRERGLEQLQINGQLSATMAVEGLQVGDVLHFVASVTDREPALGGAMQAAAVVPQGQANLGFVRTRLLWPDAAPVHWRAYGEGATPRETGANGYREVVLTGGLPKPADLPDDAPIRFRKPPLVEATSFADWAAVSRVMAPLYATEGAIKPGSTLAVEVARIAAAQSDPYQRAAAALQLVQEKVRYLYNGLDGGNYAPQSPEQTWTVRYGDCKAKTFLLVAILRALGVEAEPVLASTQFGDFLPDRLPSAGAFDHILVHLMQNGRSLWLDGTGSGSRYSDIDDVPPFRWVLPVRSSGATLLAVPARVPAEPTVTVALDYDQSAGTRLPTLVHAIVTLRGPLASTVGMVSAQGTKDQKEDVAGKLLANVIGAEVATTGYELSYDPAGAVAKVDVRGVTSGVWQRIDNRYRLLLDRAVSDLSFDPDRARPAWQAIPVSTGAPDKMVRRLRVRLPTDVKGFTLDGNTKLDETLATTSIVRTAAIDGEWITVDESARSTGGEIAPGDVAATRSRVALAKQSLLHAVAPADLPSRWISATAGRKDGRFKPLLDAYAQAIASDPKEAAGYINRANFQIGVFDWRGAMPDLDRAIALAPTADLYVQRAYAHRLLGEEPMAVADAQAARKLDPGSYAALQLLGEVGVDHGQRVAAIAPVQERIDAGGEGRTGMLTLKADLLARAGDSTGALAALDQAIASKPGNAGLLNARCWDKALLNTALDTALKDCTKSIELSDATLGALDSRAYVYFRLGRMDDAMADLSAALEQDPNQASSLYLRGVIRSRRGDSAGAHADLDAVAVMEPLLTAERKHFGIVP